MVERGRAFGPTNGAGGPAFGAGAGPDRQNEVRGFGDFWSGSDLLAAPEGLLCATWCPAAAAEMAIPLLNSG